ncbi:ATP-dependent helicase [Polaromonas sp.]|nr:ATP-dependent helicase [Candidatus Saccharibacteria bacterium]
MASNFDIEYKRLNSAQKQAVDAVEGPVLVVAGPGTGKTQLLSLRVANILKQTDVSASSILCLTFTNFAAANMRSRLNALIGPSAHRVVVRTFHSFAAEIMNQYPDYFWNGARLSIAPDATQIEIIQDILGSLPLDNPLASRFAGSLTAIKDVQEALKLTKEAGLTPGKLAAMINYNTALINQIEPQLIELLSPTLSAKRLPELEAAVLGMADNDIADIVKPLKSLTDVLKSSIVAAVAADAGTKKTTNTGAWKRRWLQTVNGQKGMYDERRRNAWWLAVANVYADYRDALHLRGYYDYADMVVEVISQLQQEPELLSSVQERFLYVLIDEFQDTNAAQLQLAHLVATHYSNADQPNLMAVGDDDQSIYAFNGAELNNMLNFKETYPATKTIVLTENYRSAQAILDTAQAIIEQADDRLVNRQPELVKHLTAASDAPAGTIEHRHYPTRDHELLAVADAITKAWPLPGEQTLAVLARSHDSLRRLSVLLNDRQVAINYEQQNNILESEVVQLVFLLAQTVQAIAEGDERQVNVLLASLVRYPVWGISPTALWQLATANYAAPHWLDSLLQHDDEALVALANWLLWLSQSNAPLPLLIEYLLGLRTGEHLTSPIRAHYLALPITTTYMEALSAIQLLVTLSHEFSEGEAGKLHDFTRFVDLNSGLQRTVTDQSWFTSGQNAVQLMTVHKSKGLEFDTVYLLDAVEDTWQPHSVSRKPPANLPLQPYGELYDDYVRLLYVAATRAKSSLIVASFGANEQGKVVLPTPLVTNALETVTVPGNDVASATVVLESALRWPRLETSDEKILLASRLDDFYLSATGMLQFLNIAGAGPQNFLENQLLRLPGPTSAVMSYGTAVHAGLQAGQLLVNDDMPPLPGVLERFATVLRGQHLAEDELERYLPFGEAMLTDLFTTKCFALPKGGLAEVTLNDIYIGEARLGGKLDHILTRDNLVTISDYKTGKPLNSFATRDQTKVVKAWQHRTQLLFYALLVSGASRFAGATALETQMLYVEAETDRELALQLIPSQAEMERIEGLAVAVWQHVTDLNFPDTSKYTTDITGIMAFEDDLLSGVI